MSTTHNVGQLGADCHPHLLRSFAASDDRQPLLAPHLIVSAGN